MLHLLSIAVRHGFFLKFSTLSRGLLWPIVFLFFSFFCCSGMAALSAVTRTVAAGGEIIGGNDIYGGMHRLLTRVTKLAGITVKFVDTRVEEKMRAALTPQTKLVGVSWVNG